MKVVIFAGGKKGIRLREDTEYRPKALAPIGGYPIVWHIMNLYSYYGYNDFVLLLGPDSYKIKSYFLSYNEMIRNFTLELGSQPKPPSFQNSKVLRDWKISFVDTGITMTGKSLAQVEPFIDKGSSFFLSYCDTLSNVNITDLKRFHEAMGRVVTITGAHPTFPLGIVEAEDGLVTTFREKKSLEGLVNGGFFVCDYRIFDYLKLEGDFMFEEEPLQRLIKEHELALFEHKDFWYRVDTHKDIEVLEGMWNANRALWKVWQD